MRIVLDDLTGPEVRAMVSDHLADMRATSPPESVHALSIAQIHADAVTFWSVWDGEHLAGCGGLKPCLGAKGNSSRCGPPPATAGVASAPSCWRI